LSILTTGRKHTEEVRDLMSKHRRGINNPFYNKKHSIKTLDTLRDIARNRNYTPVKELEVEITDLETKISTTHGSIRETVKFLKSDIKTLLRR
jgi:NUMOD3 motif